MSGPHTRAQDTGSSGPACPPPAHPSGTDRSGRVPTRANAAEAGGQAVADDAASGEQPPLADPPERAPREPRPGTPAGDAALPDHGRGTDGEQLAGPLPAAVRHRVVALAAEALAAMSTEEIPGPLRHIARFTPSRRARHGGDRIATVLETDPLFRRRVGERVRQAVPELAAALEAGTVPAAADPPEVAAVAYLLRPDGWVALVASAGQAAQQAEQRRVGAQAADRVVRLEQELAALRASAREEQERLRAELDQVRKEADHLRRQVRGAQGEVRHAQKQLRAALGELATEQGRTQSALGAADKESRRLRGRLAEAEAALEAGRKAAREGRSMADIRVRLLLDTVLEAAQGLRRELALPPVSMRPADTVDAVEPCPSGTRDVAHRALAGDDPALLDQLLALPQAHLVVDGYNVTKTGYPSLALSEQRVRLLGGLAVLAAQSGAEVTCVFDGADLDTPVLLAPPRGVRVRFSKPGQTADDLIRAMVRAEPPGRPVVVVSTDREVADGVRRAGARPVPSTMLLRRLSRG